MNHKLIIFVLSFGSLVAFSCTEPPVGQQPIDSTSPAPVSNVRVENTAGGAILKYTLPEDEDLLYVKAVYPLKDGMAEAKSSLYNDTIKIEGFGDIEPREVSVIAVDRSRNESTPVKVMIEPKEPPVIAIGKSLTLDEDFGGVMATWKNPNRNEVSVHIIRQDSLGEYQPLESFYTTVRQGSGTARGLDTIPANFGVYVQDRWNNICDTLYKELTPWYEASFDRTKWANAKLPNDEPDVYGWVMERMWDGVYGPGTDNGFSSGAGTGRWPHSCTIDLGVVGRINRLLMYQRGSWYVFSEGAPKSFELYGATEYDATGNWDSWTLLGTFNSVKPSGLPMGQNTAEDEDVAMISGENFFLPRDAPAVRWIRLKVTATWSGMDCFQIGELFVFGDNRSELYK